MQIENAKPLLTVLLITYNHANYIEQCIKSILVQKTDFDFKIIISDDCSTDGTTDIVRNYSALDSRIIPVIRDKNVGAKEAIKHCFKMVDTEYFTIIEGDDLWNDDTKLQQQIKLLQENSDCSICSHEVIINNVQEGTQELQISENHGCKLSQNIYKWDIYDSPHVHTSARVYRNIIPSDERILNFIVADIYMFYYALDKGKNIFINKPMSTYNVHPTGAWSSLTDKERLLNYKIACLTLDYFFDYKYTKKFSPKYVNERGNLIFDFSFAYNKNKKLQFSCRKINKR